MKSIIFFAAIVAMTTGTQVNAQVSVVTGDKQITCTSQHAETVLTGAWQVTTSNNGSIAITDQKNQLVRFVTGQPTATEGYPISLVADKCGNLHITDIAGINNNALSPERIPTANFGWSNPDAAETVENSTAVITTNPKIIR